MRCKCGASIERLNIMGDWATFCMGCEKRVGACSCAQSAEYQPTPPFIERRALSTDDQKP